MAINPEEITTIRIDQLANEALTLASILPHQIGTDLKQANIQQLVDFVATAVDASGGVGFIALSVTDGQQLPDVPTNPSFFLAGAGTYLNINGYPDIVCTENLNAIMSLSDHWELAVEIPITPLIPLVQSVTGTAVNNADPLNPVVNISSLQQVLDNNHDLTNNNNFQGTDAGLGATGTNINAFGSSAGKNQSGVRNNAFGTFALEDNTGDDVNGFGRLAASLNIGNHVNAFGNTALNNNSGNNANAFGDRAGDGNTHNNVNLFGLKAEADAANQNVFSKSASDQVRMSFNDITGFKKVEIPNKDGTFAYLDDCDTTAILNNIGNGSTIDLQYLPDAILGQLVYGGGVNATTAVATLTNNAKAKLGTASATITLTNNTAAITGYIANEGIFYIATTAGTFATISFEVGDWLISTGSSWTKVDNTDAVSSVAGRTGVVVLTKSDVDLANVDNTSDANKPISTATQTALDLKADITEYPETTYSQTITYTATLAPSGGLTANYRATRVGKCVSVRFNFKNAVAGTGVTVAIIPFPSGLPSPAAITDFNTNNDFIGTGSGVFQTAANSGVASRVVLRKVTGGYEIHLIASSASYISGIVNFQYFIS